MSEQEQQDLDAFIAEAERKLAELKAQKAERDRAERDAEAERKRLEEAKRPIVLRVIGLQGATVIIEGFYRADVFEVISKVPGRTFNGYLGDGKTGRNGVPLSEFKTLMERLSTLPNLSIVQEKGVEREIEWWLNAPPWEVTVHPSGRHLIAIMGPKQSHYKLHSIPGGEWDWDLKSWKLPLSEGWRIPKLLEGIEGVVYEEEAAKLIFEQVKTRSRIDTIAQQEDSDFIDRMLPELLPRLTKAAEEGRAPYIGGFPKGIHTDGRPGRPFQRVGVEFLHATDGQCIEGDDTGLGKTFQSLVYSEIERKHNDLDLVLVVVKAGNLPNWINEVKWLTETEPIVCKGGKPDGWVVQQIMSRAKPYVIISYDTLGSYVTDVDPNNPLVEKNIYLWAGIFEAVKPGLVIYDEAHMIKNPDSHRSRAARRLATLERRLPMTASPILNRTEELWPLLYLLDPQMFKVHDQFVNTYTINGKTPIKVDELHELLRPRFIRRRKKDVLKDLPPINRITHFHDLSDKATRLYQMVLDGIYEELAEFDSRGVGGQQMGVMSILAQITRLKQICAVDKAREFTPDLATELVDSDANGGKVLIFSQFKGTCYAIAQRLGHQTVSTVRRTDRGFVSMTPTQRHELFEEARHREDVKYIVTVAHPATGLEGHNLEFCKWVIFNDPLWSPGAHDQCEGRAYGRLSNPHPIDAYYIVADVEIEKWINELLVKKLDIINQTVEGIEGSRIANESIANELIAKMRELMWTRGKGGRR